MSAESASRAVEWASSPPTSSTRNITALMARTPVRTRRWRSATSRITQQSRIGWVLPSLRRQHGEADADDAGLDRLEGPGGGVGEVEDAAGDGRAAIVDAHLHLAVVVEVHDAQARAEGQRGVRGRQG